MKAFSGLTPLAARLIGLGLGVQCYHLYKSHPGGHGADTDSPDLIGVEESDAYAEVCRVIEGQGESMALPDRLSASPLYDALRGGMFDGYQIARRLPRHAVYTTAGDCYHDDRGWWFCAEVGPRFRYPGWGEAAVAEAMVTQGAAAPEQFAFDDGRMKVGPFADQECYEFVRSLNALAMTLAMQHAQDRLPKHCGACGVADARWQPEGAGGWRCDKCLVPAKT